MGVNRDSLSPELEDGRQAASAVSGRMPPGSSVSLDGTLPPSPLRELLELDGAAIFVFSADHELTETVVRSGGERYPIRSIAGWDELVDAVARERAHILLLDADSLPVPLPDAVATLHGAAPTIVVLVAARRDTAGTVMSLMAERKVHRLLVKPATDGMTRLLLESAIERYLALREQSIPPPVFVDEVRPRRRYRKSRSSWSAWRLAAALVLATAGAVVVAEMRGFGWQEAIERLVVRGAEGGREREGLPEPSDGLAAGSATPAPLRASAADDGVSVTATTDTVLTVVFEAPSANEPAGSVSAAAASSSGSDAATPEFAVIPPVTDERYDVPLPPGPQTSASRAADEPDASEMPAAAAGTEIDFLLDLIDARLVDGRLLAPYGDSAVGYFEQAMALNPLDPRLLTRRDVIAAGLVDAAHAALERGDLVEAVDFADEAFRLGADRTALARFDRELDAARREQTLARQAERLAAARTLLRQGRLLDADGGGALATVAELRRERSSVVGLDDVWREVTAVVAAEVSAAIDTGDYAAARRWASALAIPGGDPALAAELEFEARQAEFLATPIAAGELRLIEFAAPVYPDDALAAGIEGWVDVEYVVDREGRPRDIVVVDSRPGRRFVDAAIDAVESHRYEPFLLDGRVYERRVRMRVRFEVQ